MSKAGGRGKKLGAGVLRKYTRQDDEQYTHPLAAEIRGVHQDTFDKVAKMGLTRGRTAADIEQAASTNMAATRKGISASGAQFDSGKAQSAINRTSNAIESGRGAGLSKASFAAQGAHDAERDDLLAMARGESARAGHRMATDANFAAQEGIAKTNRDATISNAMAGAAGQVIGAGVTKGIWASQNPDKTMFSNAYARSETPMTPDRLQQRNAVAGGQSFWDKLFTVTPYGPSAASGTPGVG